ncbi:MAG: single-stranded DNA-binding protein [Oscillospiraceae bacterium]|nr:single-stranded DNA-binding protein [Oscillospiraceae bacterium]
MLNRSVMMGRLCADPELRTTQSDIPVCTFRIAVERDFSKGDEKKADFFDVVAWRSTAEFVCKYFAKGRMIVTDGRMQTRDWVDKNNNKRTTTELVADHVYFGEGKRDGGSQSAGESSGREEGGYEACAGYSAPAFGSVPDDFAPDF